MGKRFTSNDLKEMIRQLVREEVKDVVLETVNHVLAERYLRRLAESAVSAAPRGTNRLPIQGDDRVEGDDEAPQVLANTILGVGEEDPVFKKVPKDDGVRQHEEGYRREADPSSIFFEGTVPITERDAQAGYEADLYEGLPEEDRRAAMLTESPGDDDPTAFPEPPGPRAAPQRVLPAPGAEPKMPGAPGARKPLTEVWRTLAGVNAEQKPAAAAGGPSPEELAKFEELRLKRMRESLEVKVG
jgi:hypothetical protein